MPTYSILLATRCPPYKINATYLYVEYISELSCMYCRSGLPCPMGLRYSCVTNPSYSPPWSYENQTQHSVPHNCDFQCQISKAITQQSRTSREAPLINCALQSFKPHLRLLCLPFWLDMYTDLDDHPPMYHGPRTPSSTESH